MPDRMKPLTPLSRRRRVVILAAIAPLMIGLFLGPWLMQVGGAPLLRNTALGLAFLSIGICYELIRDKPVRRPPPPPKI
jgi:hypothetical protein